MKKVILILSLILTLSLFSCSVEIYPPEITSVLVVDEYGYTIDTASIGDTIYALITVTDADKDMEILNVKQYLNNVLIYNIDLELTKPLSETVTYIAYLYILGPAGYWRNDLMIIDAQDNESNVYTVYFTVI